MFIKTTLPEPEDETSVTAVADSLKRCLEMLAIQADQVGLEETAKSLLAQEKIIDKEVARLQGKSGKPLHSGLIGIF